MCNTCASLEPSARRRHLLGVVHRCQSCISLAFLLGLSGTSLRGSACELSHNVLKDQGSPPASPRTQKIDVATPRVSVFYTTDLQYADVLLPVAEWHLERRSSELRSSASFCFGASRSLSTTKNTSRSLRLDGNSEPIAAMRTGSLKPAMRAVLQIAQQVR